MADFLAPWSTVWALVANTWWLWLPILLFLFAKNFWALYLKIRYFKLLKWVLLEVKIPRNIAKSPQAMEQVFAGLQTMYFAFDPMETWWEGLQHDYIVFEMASMGGDTRFYIRVPEFFRNVVEAQVYAQYPECEIVEADDYMRELPAVVPNEGWDMIGVEFKFTKPNAYPIRTYVEFPTIESMKEEERKVDPFASFVELFGKIRPGEHLGYQIMFWPAQRPTPDAWIKEGEKLVDKLIGRKPSDEKKIGVMSILETLGGFIGEVAATLFSPPTAEPVKPKREEKDGATLMQHLSPGVKDIVAAIERKMVKPGFEAFVRLCYIGRRDLFHLSHFSSSIGALKTYNTSTLNAFALNPGTLATHVFWGWPKFYKRKRKLYKGRLFYYYYKTRKPFTSTFALKSQSVILNTEELATIYHYPGATAKAPMMPRIEAKRSEPPATLPIG